MDDRSAAEARPNGPDAKPRRAVSVSRGTFDGADETVTLDYDGRMIRRKRLVTDTGAAILVDLEAVTSLEEGDSLELEHGGRIGVRAAPETLLEIRGDLPRLAWHIGNRHAPCQIGDGHLLIRQDHVLAAMLRQLGADVTEITGPFRPEGGAYGHGRTMGHDHGHSGDHDHAHPHDHAHRHAHDHDPQP
nr:urease accessory protein UreE [Tropicimonas sp. IMCC34011]